LDKRGSRGLGLERMTTETDEVQTGDTMPTVGEQLRSAREAKGVNLEEIASQTRIPRRHLESLEQSDWSRLPAPTYTIGFAKSYASAVGLDRTAIGDQLRAEMGGQRADVATAAEVFQPADPKRTMPRWLVLGAIGAIVVLVVLMTWLNKRSLEGDAPPAETATAEQGQPLTPAPQPVAPQPAAAAEGPVVLTATAPAWIQVTDGGRTLFQGELAPGQTFAVPAGAAAPMLKAGKPEALRVTIGSAVAPPVGPAGKVASNISLRPADLMGRGAAPAATPSIPAPSAPPGVQNTAG